MIYKIYFNLKHIKSYLFCLVFCYTGYDGRRLYPGGGVNDDRSAAGQRCHPHAQSGNIY